MIHTGKKISIPDPLFERLVSVARAEQTKVNQLADYAIRIFVDGYDDSESWSSGQEDEEEPGIDAEEEGDEADEDQNSGDESDE